MKIELYCQRPGLMAQPRLAYAQPTPTLMRGQWQTAYVCQCPDCFQIVGTGNWKGHLPTPIPH